eukprot:COSAG06_NODE_22173_length_731_cov_2.215190_1_plen_37_part_10
MHSSALAFGWQLPSEAAAELVPIESVKRSLVRCVLLL